MAVWGEWRVCGGRSASHLGLLAEVCEHSAKLIQLSV